MSKLRGFPQESAHRVDARARLLAIMPERIEITGAQLQPFFDLADFAEGGTNMEPAARVVAELLRRYDRGEAGK